MESKCKSDCEMLDTSVWDKSFWDRFAAYLGKLKILVVLIIMAKNKDIQEVEPWPRKTLATFRW
jgi:hypothetical protein